MPSAYTNLLYHIVYSTKYRREIIGLDWQPDLYAYIGGIIRERDGILLEIGGVADHIHLLAKLSPKLAIMDVLRDIKAVSSKWVNDRGLADQRFEWQTGYGAFSVSKSQAPGVGFYIRNQAEHHRQIPFQDEFILFLNKHDIEFDPRFLFEEEHIG